MLNTKVICTISLKFAARSLFSSRGIRARIGLVELQGVGILQLLVLHLWTSASSCCCLLLLLLLLLQWLLQWWSSASTGAADQQISVDVSGPDLPGHGGAGRIAPAMADVDRDSSKARAFEDRAHTGCPGQVSLPARFPGCPCAAWSLLAHTFGSHVDWTNPGLICRVTGKREDATPP